MHTEEMTDGQSNFNRHSAGLQIYLESTKILKSQKHQAQIWFYEIDQLVCMFVPKWRNIYSLVTKYQKQKSTNKNQHIYHKVWGIFTNIKKL
jgi:hypothetical protein